MRLKKFICIRCGAPKVNAYTTPYIVCDFCGTLTDIDYAIGVEGLNESLEDKQNDLYRKLDLETKSAGYLYNKDKENYYKSQYEYWNYYYTHCPQYLPPTVNTPEKYNLYIMAAAEEMTYFSFEAKQSELYMVYYKKYQYPNPESYYEVDRKRYVKWDPFIKMINIYFELVKECLKALYGNPKYVIMKDLVPEDVHLKLRISQTMQIWIPYLEDKYVKELLKMYNLVDEYTEVPRPTGKEGNCTKCNEELFIPFGAIKVICPKCSHEEIITQSVNCTSCGTENELPDDWSKTILCNSCGVHFEAIRPLFG